MNPLLLDEAIRLHDVSVKEKCEVSTNKACDILEKLLSLHPENTKAMAYLGSVYTLKGRDALLPWKKIKWVKEGITLLNKAVQRDPNNREIRLLRYNNYKSLPYFFQDEVYIKADEQFLNQI